MKGVAVIGASKSSGILKRMLYAHGHTFDLKSCLDSNYADFYFQTNILKHYEGNKVTRDAFEFIARSDKPSIVNESPIFRDLQGNSKLTKWHRLAWNSYFYNTGTYPKNCPSDRWEIMQKDFDLQIKPWDDNGDYVLLCLQKIGDSSLNHLYKKYNTDTAWQAYTLWLKDTLDEIRRNTDRKIVIRPHPNNMRPQVRYFSELASKYTNVVMSSNFEYNGSVTMAPSGGLKKDILDSKCVIVFSSLTAVESIFNGKPTYTLDPSSVASPIARSNLHHIETAWQPVDRQQWLNDMSYAQWTGEEIQRGDPWPTLQSLFEQAKTQKHTQIMQ